MRAVYFAVATVIAGCGLGAQTAPAEAQFYSYSRFSSSSTGFSSVLVSRGQAQNGRIVRGYYNRFGQVVAKVRQAPEADPTPAPIELDAAARATTYETGAKALGQRSPPAARVRAR